MQHFFVSPEQVREEKIYVEGSDVNHMKNVLRMKTGEELTIGDHERDRKRQDSGQTGQVPCVGE